jgi:hypothetical protein
VSAQAAQQTGQGGAAATGLVSYSTTHTPTETFEVSSIDSRWRRMKRSIRWTASCFEAWSVGRPAMITLTYADVDGWKPNHLREFLTTVRNHMSRRGHRLRYIAVAELQARGAVHYHVVVWLPKGMRLPKPDKQGWWLHGTSRIELATKPVGYLISYVKKLDQKAGTFPKGLRVHSCGGLEKPLRMERTHHMLPTWLRNETAPFHRMRRASGGGWTSQATGEFFKSPFQLLYFASRAGVGPVIKIARIQ